MPFEWLRDWLLGNGITHWQRSSFPSNCPGFEPHLLKRVMKLNRTRFKLGRCWGNCHGTKAFHHKIRISQKRSFCWSCFHSRNRGSILQRTVSRHDKPQHSEKQILILSTHKTHTRKARTHTDTGIHTRTRTHAHALTLPELRVCNLKFSFQCRVQSGDCILPPASCKTRFKLKRGLFGGAIFERKLPYQALRWFQLCRNRNTINMAKPHYCIFESHDNLMLGHPQIRYS